MKKYVMAILVSMMCMGILAGCGGKTSVSLMDYVTVEFSGVDGGGTASVSVDQVRLEQDLVEDKDGAISKEELERIAAITPFEFSINYELDKKESLSNGDTVTVTATYNEDLAKEAGVKVKGKTSEKVKVEGLKEPIPLDAFDKEVFDTEDGVEVVLDGVAPLATLTIDNHCANDRPQAFVTYKADKDYEIKNGDQITITAELSEEAMAEGYVLNETETTITVEGLNSYITDVSQLKAEDIALIEGKLEEAVKKKYNANEMLDIYAASGQNVTLFGDDIGTYSNPVFGKKGYTSVSGSWMGETGMVVFTFQIDAQDVTLYWWENEYYDTPQKKTFADMSGYCTISDLMLSPEGELITGEKDNYIEVSSLYESESNMTDELKSRFESLTEGTFQK